MSRSLAEFSQNHVAPNWGRTERVAPGLWRWDLRSFEQYQIPDPNSSVRSDSYYIHRQHAGLPVVYVSGRLNNKAIVERQWVYECLLEAGIIGIEMVTPNAVYKSEHPLFPNMGEEVVVGRSLAHILVSNGVLPISQIGPFSVAELALADFLGIPIVGVNGISHIGKPQTVDTEQLGRLRGDSCSILAHMDRLGLMIRSYRKMTEKERKGLDGMTFWQCIEAYFNEPVKVFGLVPDSLVKHRLMPLFGAGSYPLFETIKPSLNDCRTMRWWIDGQLKTVELYTFDTDEEDLITGFWHIEDDQPVYCRWTRQGNNYVTEPGRIWVDDGI